MPETVLWSDLLDEQGPFFRALYTTDRAQTGFMTIPPGQEAGPAETHNASDQVFYIVRGKAEFKVWNKGEAEEPLHRTAKGGHVVVVPAGVPHWVKSTGQEPLRFLTVYAPAEY